MNNEDARSDTAHLLVREPKKLTEQEVEHCEALAEVLYQMFTRQHAKQEPVLNLDSVHTSPTVFSSASTALN